MTCRNLHTEERDLERRLAAVRALKAGQKPPRIRSQRAWRTAAEKRKIFLDARHGGDGPPDWQQRRVIRVIGPTAPMQLHHDYGATPGDQSSTLRGHYRSVSANSTVTSTPSEPTTQPQSMESNPSTIPTETSPTIPTSSEPLSEPTQTRVTDSSPMEVDPPLSPQPPTSNPLVSLASLYPDLTSTDSSSEAEQPQEIRRMQTPSPSLTESETRSESPSTFFVTEPLPSSPPKSTNEPLSSSQIYGEQSADHFTPSFSVPPPNHPTFPVPEHPLNDNLPHFTSSETSTTPTPSDRPSYTAVTALGSQTTITPSSSYKPHFSSLSARRPPHKRQHGDQLRPSNQTHSSSKATTNSAKQPKPATTPRAPKPPKPIPDAEGFVTLPKRSQSKTNVYVPPEINQSNKFDTFDLPKPSSSTTHEVKRPKLIVPTTPIPGLTSPIPSERTPKEAPKKSPFPSLMSLQINDPTSWRSNLTSQRPPSPTNWQKQGARPKETRPLGPPPPDPYESTLADCLSSIPPPKIPLEPTSTNPEINLLHMSQPQLRAFHRKEAQKLTRNTPRDTPLDWNDFEQHHTLPQKIGAHYMHTLIDQHQNDYNQQSESARQKKIPYEGPTTPDIYTVIKKITRSGYQVTPKDEENLANFLDKFPEAFKISPIREELETKPLTNKFSKKFPMNIAAITVVQETSNCASIVKDLLKENTLYCDTESFQCYGDWKCGYTHGPARFNDKREKKPEQHVSMIQVATDKHAYLFDIGSDELTDNFLNKAGLRQIFEKQHIEKVWLCADEEEIRLRTHLGINMVHHMDLQHEFLDFISLLIGIPCNEDYRAPPGLNVMLKSCSVPFNHLKDTVNWKNPSVRKYMFRTHDYYRSQKGRDARDYAALDVLTLPALHYAILRSAAMLKKSCRSRWSDSSN